MMRMYELAPSRWQNQKSFYGKATVFMGDGREILKSYDTIIMERTREGEYRRYWDGYSMTTGKHIRAFSGLSKKEFEALPLCAAPKTLEVELEF